MAQFPTSLSHRSDQDDYVRRVHITLPPGATRVGALGTRTWDWARVTCKPSRVKDVLLGPKEESGSTSFSRCPVVVATYGVERVVGIGGYFDRAADPAALGAWYRDSLRLDADENGLWRQGAGPTVFATF